MIRPEILNTNVCCLAPGVNESSFSEILKESLLRNIKELKKDIKPKPKEDWYEGRRYYDDERIAYCILGALERMGITGDPYLSIAETKLLIERAVRYSASCDYYYEFEKEW